MHLSEVLVSFVRYNNGNVVQKLAPFCIPCRVVASFLHGLLLKIQTGTKGRAYISDIELNDLNVAAVQLTIFFSVGHVLKSFD